MIPTTVTCPGCGNAVPAGDRFCGTCGTPITGSALLTTEGARFDPWDELLQKLRNATLGEYDIKGELGRGGMAAVFLAHDLQLNRKVAIKVMLPGLVYGESMWDRFLAEARTAARLDHPNIVYIHSVKEKDRFLYFVMKYISGRTVDDILAQHGQMQIKPAQTILVEVAKALDYAHGEGVVHRDIKPANIMIDQKGNATVMDFGIARAADSQHFTQTGATIGTPAYMSPEQCHGEETTAASDQYSLGVLAYEMFAGAPPFTGTPIELQMAHMQDSPPPLRERRPDLSLELSGAVMRMLAKDPADRWPSLTTLVPIFGRGLKAKDDAPRQVLVEIVKEGASRRPSMPVTPISREMLATKPRAAGATASALDSPTVISAPMPTIGLGKPATPVTADASVTSATPVAPDGLPDPDAPLMPPPARAARRPLVPVVAGALVVLAVVATLMLRPGKAPPAAATVAPAPLEPPTAATVLATMLGDSAVIGPGPDATATVNGRATRAVNADAIALVQVSIPAPHVTVGDTVRVKLDALDDAGLHVSTTQTVWSISNPRIAKWAAPGIIVAMATGKATITVTAGSGSATRELVVEPKAAPKVAPKTAPKPGTSAKKASPKSQG